MKQVLMGLFLAASLAAQAQDVKTTKKFFEKKEFDKAQQAIDAAVAKEDKKPENWYWKHKVYSAIASSDQFKKLVPNARRTGWDALAKYVALDKNMKDMLLDNQLNYMENFNGYYTAFVKEGSVHLDAKNYAEAVSNFKNALDVSKFFYTQKFTTNELDTSITFYTGYAAMKGDLKQDAEVYYKRLVDANASGTDLQIAYGWLANYYITDTKNFTKALEVAEKGLKLYPTDEYLIDQKSAAIAGTGDMKAIFANHEASIAKPDAPYSEYLRYAADLYDYIYNDSTKKTDLEEKAKKFEEVMGKGLTMKPNSSEGNYLMGFHHANKAAAIDKQLKLYKNKKTPADLEAKKKLEATRATEVDASIKNHELTASLYRSKGATLKDNEKINYKATLTNLVNLYKFKNNLERSKSYEADLKALK
jgi:hypothetical protein